MRLKKINIKKAVSIVNESKNIVAFTGAGISVESGIPDFRSSGGLWEKFNPEEYASMHVFKSSPDKFWEMYKELAQVVFSAEPNPAHIALFQLEQKGKLKAIITQNIDKLHTKVGNSNVLEIHGSGETAHCLNCHHEYSYAFIQENLTNGPKAIFCFCGGLIKPDIILFGEPLPQAIMLEAHAAIKKADLLLIIGSSLQVYPAADLPLVAKKSKTKIIIINMEKTQLDHIANLTLHGKAGEILPKMLNALN